MIVSGWRHTVAAGLVCASISVPAMAQQPPSEAGEDRMTIAFTDPSRPGALEVTAFTGSIAVKGTARKDVQILSVDHEAVRRDRRRNDRPPTPGLRRLTQRAGFEVEEEENVVSIRSESPTRARDFTIEVPARTTLMLKSVEGAISVDGIEGEIEIEAVDGAVTLTNISGTVVAHTVDGDIKADIRRVAADKPMSFVSVDGVVDVTLPASVKANLKMRSMEGEIYTDFDLQSQTPRTGRGDTAANSRRLEVETTIYGAVNGGGPDYELRTVDGNIYVRKGR